MALTVQGQGTVWSSVRGRVSPAGDGAGGPVGGVLLDHGEVGVEGDADGGVEGDLEGRAQVLRAHHRPQLLRVDLLLDLRKQLAELLYLPRRLALQPISSWSATARICTHQHVRHTASVLACSSCRRALESFWSTDPPFRTPAKTQETQKQQLASLLQGAVTFGVGSTLVHNSHVSFDTSCLPDYSQASLKGRGACQSQLQYCSRPAPHMARSMHEGAGPWLARLPWACSTAYGNHIRHSPQHSIRSLIAVSTVACISGLWQKSRMGAP